MSLRLRCARCDGPVTQLSDGVECATHGRAKPLLRPAELGYDAWAALLAETGMPLYLPWPLSPGWRITDFAAVPDQASMSVVSGYTDLDGEVSAQLISEEPGVGLGERLAGADPGTVADQIGAEPAAVTVHLGNRVVPLWSIETPSAEAMAQAAFAGELDGRWLWLVMRPGSAALLLRDPWLLADAAGFGPSALDLPFGETR